MLVALSGSLSEVPKNGCFSDVHGTGDFLDLQPFCPQSFGSLWFGFRSPLFPACVDASLFGDGDACGLSFLSNFLLHLGYPEKNGGQHSSDGSAEVDLLCYRDDSKSAFAPVAQRVDAVS